MNYESDSVPVPGSGRNEIFAAFEDVRIVIIDNDFAIQVQEFIDANDDSITEASNEESKVNVIDDAFDPVFGSGGNQATLKACDGIEVYWPDDLSYHTGFVESIDNGERSLVNHDDGYEERLNMCEETWRVRAINGATAKAIATLKCDCADVISTIFEAFGSKPFL